MKSGRPKNDPTQPPRKARPESQAPDALSGMRQAPALAQPNGPRRARKKAKRALLSAILADTNLTDEDRKSIAQASEEGVTIADLSALVLYEIKCVQRFHASGDLAAKDMVVGLNKIASQVAAATQLLATASGSGVGKLEITFSNESKSDSPTGDRVDVEG